MGLYAGETFNLIEPLVQKAVGVDISPPQNLKGEELGKGISHYDCNEIKKIKGKKTSDLKNILGYHGRDEIIHRDFLTLND